MGNPCNVFCENTICGYSCICIFFLLGLGCIIQLFFVPGAVEDAFYDTINDRIVMTQAQQDDNTEDYQNWVNNNNSDAPLQLFEYWIYNITNPYDVPNGDYPIFDLLGPFTFRRYERRSAPNQSDEEPRFFEADDETTVEFDYLYTFEFQPDRSTPNNSLDDMVWVISGAMQGFFSNVVNNFGSDPFIIACIDQALSEYPGHSVFYHTPIRNLAHGLEDPWILRLDEYCAGNGLWDAIKPNTLYSLIADGRNDVIQHTGKANLTKVAELEQFRNWTTPEVNSYKLGGGDLWLDHNETVSGARETRNFPPKNWINKDRALSVWSLEKFRVTKYLYDREVRYKGVDLMRFRLDDNEGKACEYEYENGSIVDESANCKYSQFWEDGVWNLTNLRGSPSFLSKGRFLDAPYFLNTTNKAFGLPMPSYEEDDQYFDVDPLSGIVLRNWHNYQINFKFIAMDRPYATNFTNFSIYDKLIPMAYVRVEALATDEQMDFYSSALKAIDVINGFSLYGGPALAVIFFGFMFFILCKMKRQGSGYTDDGQYGRLVEDASHTDIPMAKTMANTDESHGRGGDVTKYGSTEAQH